MNEIVIFLNINPENLLILGNLLDFLILNSNRIIIHPIRKVTDILKISWDYNITQKNLRFFLVTKQDEMEMEKNLFKDNLFEIPILHFTNIKTSKFIKKIFNNFDSRKQNFKNKILKIYNIDSIDFFKFCIQKPSYFFKKLNINHLTIQDFQRNMWVNSIFIWHLYFSKKLSIQSCSLKIKKISKNLFRFLNKQKKDNDIQKCRKFNSLRELPLYFINHSTILDSFLNTPFMVLIFELWKNEGFMNILQFLGKINIFQEDFQKSWVMFDQERKTIILKDYEIEIKKFNPIFGLIFIFKKKLTHLLTKNEVSSLDMALIIRSIFDRRIEILHYPLNKIKFLSGVNCLFKNKKLNKYVERGKKIQEFISRVGRIILLKKAFLSRKKYRILYITGSILISYRMVEGLLNLLISAFNKNGMQKKLFLLIIKENIFNTMFVSHQDKNMFVMYQKLIISNQVKKKIHILEEEENLFVIKFPKDYEIELITIFSSLGYIKNTHS